MDEQSGEEKRMSALAKDIEQGKIPPVIRQIRSAKYGLGIAAIKAVLEKLVQLGVLENGMRNSYRLKTPH